MKVILFWLLFLSIILKEGRAYFKHAATLENSRGTFCMEIGPKEAVNEIPNQPKLALVLKVAYPNFSVAEAGKTTISPEELFHGRHNITFKYFISNMAHDLSVQLDGSPQKFIKSDESGWYSVSSFREIDVLTQGNIKLKSCSEEASRSFPTTIINEVTEAVNFTCYGDDAMKEVKFQKDFSSMDDDFLESEERFFLRDTETTEKYLFNDFAKKTSGKSVYNHMSTTANVIDVGDLGKITTKVGPPSNDEKKIVPDDASAGASFPPPSAINDRKVDVEKDQNEERSISNGWDVVTDIEKHSATPTESTFNEDPYNNGSFLIDSFTYNDTLSENGRTENVLSAHESHNYAIAITLLLSLIGLVIVAIIVSVIFHRKNKKLVLAKPRPSNKLHKLYNSSTVSGETSVMLEKLESTLESEC